MVNAAIGAGRSPAINIDLKPRIVVTLRLLLVGVSALRAWRRTGSGAAKAAHGYLVIRTRLGALQCLQDRRCAALKRRPMLSGKNNDRQVPPADIDVKAKTPVRCYDRLETGPFGGIDEKPVYEA